MSVSGRTAFRGPQEGEQDPQYPHPEVRALASLDGLWLGRPHYPHPEVRALASLEGLMDPGVGFS